jgi:1-acyl-sn-glycerol-3-phosphate acyltransferase
MRIIIKAILHFLVIVVYRVKVVGKENIPKEGAAILCPNHINALDSVCIVVTAKRKVEGLAKESLYRFWIIRYLGKIFGIYPVKREEAAISAVKMSLKVLKKGGLLFIFPEGTRNGMAKGKKVKNGAVNIAIKAEAPIIPIGIQGSFKVFTKVKVNIGKPIYYDKETSKEQVDNLTNELMEEIVRLTNEQI